MFKDLESHADAIAAHRLTRQLVGRVGTQYLGLPDEIRELELDEKLRRERQALSAVLRRDGAEAEAEVERSLARYKAEGH